MRFGAPGDGCPEGTQQVVRVTGRGAQGGRRQAYKVFVIDSDEEPTAIAPFAVADLAGDNNHELCLDTTAKASRRTHDRHRP